MVRVIERNEQRNAEYFGYIGEKRYIGLGIGKDMVGYACGIGRDFNLKCLTLKVADYNERAYNLYLSQGFVVSNIDHNIISMTKLL